MRISARLTLSSFFSLSALVVMIPLLFWSFNDTRKAKEDELLASNLQISMFERTVIRNEYLLYREDRTFIQWTEKNEAVDRLFRQAEVQITDKADKDVLEDMKRINKEVVAIFGRYVKISENIMEAGKTSGFEKRLISQNLLKASALINFAD